MFLSDILLICVIYERVFLKVKKYPIFISTALLCSGLNHIIFIFLFFFYDFGIYPPGCASKIQLGNIQCKWEIKQNVIFYVINIHILS